MYSRTVKIAISKTGLDILEQLDLEKNESGTK